MIAEETSLEIWAPRVLSLLRIAVALFFLEHGMQKLFGFPPRASGMGPVFPSLLWCAGVIESVGGVLVLLGLFTRPAAFVMSGEMAIGYFMSHAPRAFFPVLNGGDAAGLYCFIFFYLVFAGPGPWSLDALWRTGNSSVRNSSVT